MISLLRKFIPDSVRMPALYRCCCILCNHRADASPGLYPKSVFCPWNLYPSDRCKLYHPWPCRGICFQESIRFPSLFDGIGMGLGFTLSITCIGAVRELLGAGQIFGHQILPLAAGGKFGYEPITIFILAPGAFFVLAMLVSDPE